MSDPSPNNAVFREITYIGRRQTDPRVVLIVYLEKGPAAAPLSERSVAGHIRDERQRVRETRNHLQKWEETWKKAGTK